MTRMLRRPTALLSVLVLLTGFLPAVGASPASGARIEGRLLGPEGRPLEGYAVVLVEATVPKSGIRRGQHIDCHVSAVFGAKSLRGGRLLSTPLETTEVKSNEMVGLASGCAFAAICTGR